MTQVSLIKKKTGHSTCTNSTGSRRLWRSSKSRQPPSFSFPLPFFRFIPTCAHMARDDCAQATHCGPSASSSVAHSVAYTVGYTVAALLQL